MPLTDLLGEQGRRALNSCVKVSIHGKPETRKYNREAAIRLLKRCFHPNGLIGVDWVQLFKEQRTYDITDIRKELVNLEKKNFGTKGENLRLVDEQRAEVEREYILATTDTEIDHGSGFIVQSHFIISNSHVVDTSLDGKTSIFISNATLDKLPCKVVYYDPAKDLALLHCQKLMSKLNGIRPLNISQQEQLPGWQVACFGYPNTYCGQAALLLTATVSGTEERYGRPPLMVLCCTGVNHGSSGGPVLSLDGTEVKVVGVLKEKHIKDILTMEESLVIAKIEEAYKTSAITDLRDEIRNAPTVTGQDSLGGQDTSQTAMHLLLLKLKRRLETESQSGLCNAITGHTLQQFINEATTRYQGNDQGELVQLRK